MIINFYSNKQNAGKSLILSAFSHLLTVKNIKNIAINPILNISSKDKDQTQSILNDLLKQKTNFKSHDIKDINTKSKIDKLVTEIENLDSKYKVVLVEIPNNIPNGLTFNSKNKKIKNLLINEFSNSGNVKNTKNFNDLDWIIYNKVPKYKSTFVDSKIKPKLKSDQNKIIATIPENRKLNSLTIEQINILLDGEYIIEKNTNRLIENYLIGTPRMDSGKHYYSSYDNAAVIIRTDRPDIQMSAIYQDVQCLILAGTEDIADYVLYEAQEREIPLIKVNTNTIETANKINMINSKTDAFHSEKIKTIANLISNQIDIKNLVST